MPALLLDAVTATGNGSQFSYSREFSEHTVQAEMGGALVATAVTIDLEGSLDGVKWFQLDSHLFTAAEITATQAMWHVAGKLVKYVRLNLITLTGGTNPTITAKYTGF